MIVICPVCTRPADKPAGHVNRAAKRGLAVYCGKVCSAIGRKRDDRTEQQKKDDKAAYDEGYRARHQSALKVKKAAYYRANIDREKERETRKKRMPQHLEYCRRPEYRAYKAEYDQQYRAQKDYGSFADASIVLLKLQEELNSRQSWLERQAAKGTMNKLQQRKRDYGRRSLKETVRRQP